MKKSKFPAKPYTAVRDEWLKLRQEGVDPKEAWQIADRKVFGGPKKHRGCSGDFFEGVQLDAASADNANFHFQKSVLRPLGFVVAFVEMKYEDVVLTFAGPGWEIFLGEQLEHAGLGRFDSMAKGQPVHIFFHLHGDKAIAGLQFIKIVLDRLHIAPLCRIAVAEIDSETWRQFYPAVEAGGGDSK